MKVLRSYYQVLATFTNTPFYILLISAPANSIVDEDPTVELCSETKVIYKQVINESHSIVQQLLEAEYEVDESIEAVQLFGSLDKAMDYLARKDGGDEEAVAPVTSVAPITDGRYVKNHVSMYNQ